MKFDKTDIIVTAYARPASGPGWANDPIYVVVQSQTGQLRMECIQPKDQTREMLDLYPWSGMAHRLMIKAVQASLDA